MKLFLAQLVVQIGYFDLGAGGGRRIARTLLAFV
jgi:hypothetical protein